MNLSGNGVYIHCVTGNIIIDNYILNEGDALGVYETETIKIKASEEALVCGTTDGKVLLKDLNTLRTWHTIYAYSGAIADIDVYSRFLIVTG